MTSSQPPVKPSAAQVALQQGLQFHRQGRLAEAKSLYETILATEPAHFDALNLLGAVALQTGDLATATALIGKAIAINPNDAAAHNNLGNALLALKRSDEALASYDRALALNPKQADTHFNRGNALLELRRPEAALASFDQVLAINPRHADAHTNRGDALANLRRLEDAVDSYDKALVLKANSAHAWLNRARVLVDIGRLTDALASFDKATNLNPSDAEIHFLRGNVLAGIGRAQEALASFDRALALNPRHVKALSNRGSMLLALGRAEEALASLDRALVYAPDRAESHYNRGNVLEALRRLDAAIENYDKAIALKPGYADAHNNRGLALLDLRRPADALASLERALALDPAIPFLRGTILSTRVKLCDWTDFEARVTTLKTDVLASRQATPPFPLLALIDDPRVHLQAARTYAAALHPERPTLDPIPKRASRPKLRIGYFSTDFHDHPVGPIAAGLLEAHDRARIEVFGFSYGPNKEDAVRRRIAAACDKFIAIGDKNDRAVALLSRSLGIDIAVDLNGHTQHARTSMFAERCAPLQIAYLGYPGTMGVNYYDYVIADDVVIPAARQGDFTEKTIRLPDSYLANGSRPAISDRTPTRSESGLPQTGTVFCCFNSTYKILPDVFDMWMRVLKGVEDSVLWIREDNSTTKGNLRKAAEDRGIDGQRLVFAGRLPHAEHLARHRLGDLLLDTLPFNAHSTGLDALWAGLPVLTCAGTSFASRVSASMLHTIGLGELVTDSLADYEAKALELGRDRAKLAAIRRKLEVNRPSSPLFDGPLLARHIETAYTTAYERFQAGLPPESFTVGPESPGEESGRRVK